MKRISFTAPTMSTNPPAFDWPSILIGITPEQYTTVKFFSGGSEATEAAIKLARQYHAPGRQPPQVQGHLPLQRYHGGTGHAMAASGQAEWKSKFEPFRPASSTLPRRRGPVAPPAPPRRLLAWPAST